MNATRQAIQEQGRIKRQMIEQEYARPFDLVMSDPSHHQGYMKQMIDRLHDEMQLKLNYQTLETNPAFLVDCKDTVKFGKVPNVKITPIPAKRLYADKRYLQTKGFSNTMSTDKVWPLTKEKKFPDEIELTFKDGEFV